MILIFLYVCEFSTAVNKNRSSSEFCVHIVVCIIILFFWFHRIFTKNEISFSSSIQNYIKVKGKGKDFP